MGSMLMLAIESSGWYFDGSAMILSVIALHTYLCFCLFNIAHKTGNPFAHAAFIPLANVFVLANAGGRSFFWGILVFIPLVQFFALAIIGIGIAERRGRPQWTGALLGIPVVNVIALTYLAYWDPPFVRRDAPTPASKQVLHQPPEARPSLDKLQMNIEECHRCGKLIETEATRASALSYCSDQCREQVEQVPPRL